MDIITSRNNEALKHARKLHMKKHRDGESLFLVEGLNCLEELARTGHPVDTLFFTPESGEGRGASILNRLLPRAGKSYQVTGELLQYTSPSESPQGVLALVPKPAWKTDAVLGRQGPFAALFNVSDPGNLGTIIRSAVAFGFGGIILSGDCVDPFNPKTVRASAGHILSVPVIKAAAPSRLQEMTDRHGLAPCLFTPGEGEPFVNPGITGKPLCIFGSEAHGVQGDLLPRGCRVFHIPMAAGVESLNLGVAVSIVMEKLYASQGPGLAR
jgi:TrmH family RNA methyltransferase